MSTLAVPRPLPAPRQDETYTYERMVAEFEESNLPCELWDGKIVMAPAPFSGHQSAVFNFAKCLDAFAKTHHAGRVFIAPLDMVLAPHQVVQPDVLFIAQERLHLLQHALMGPADLVVEVISLGSRRRDRIDKRDLYEQFGVKEYWIVDPEAQTIELFAMQNSTLRLLQRSLATGPNIASLLLPGFEVEPKAIFEG